MSETTIEWTDVTWNPTTGCDRISRGCDNCYALALAKRLKAMGQAKYQTDGDPRTSGPGFGLAVHEDTLTAPFTWTKPRKVFVNSMSDLFHARVPLDFIRRVFDVIEATPQHTYQVLTKRATRMVRLSDRLQWPRNLWMGVSVEDQEQAEQRIPPLLETPAAVRWVSAEPLLGPVDLGLPVDHSAHERDYTAGMPWPQCLDCSTGEVDVDWTVPGNPRINWLVVGGESGPGARPMHPAWARSLRDQCERARVPYFMKQAGAVLAREWGCSDHKGHDPSEWPEPFAREYPQAVAS